jgi:hypothetical protein
MHSGTQIAVVATMGFRDQAISSSFDGWDHSTAEKGFQSKL